jgi:SAM-dependent methyltransferase
MLRTDTDEPVLDLCCGAGRYSNALARRGLRVFGVDLSRDLLRSATAGPSVAAYVRGDMRRLPFADGIFSGVASLFTSFGYFESDEENRAALLEAVRVLRTGGTLLLDFFNLTRMLATLEPRSERKLGKERIIETRSYDRHRGRIEKTIRVCEGGKPNAVTEIVESVRAYSAKELAELVSSVGLSIRSRNGDLRGAAFEEASSERCVLVARK